MIRNKIKIILLVWPIVLMIGIWGDSSFQRHQIDRDMFGGGFVRAVQVDQDSENEIVVWHSQAKYFLDFAEDHVKEVEVSVSTI